MPVVKYGRSNCCASKLVATQPAFLKIAILLTRRASCESFLLRDLHRSSLREIRMKFYVFVRSSKSRQSVRR